MASWADKHLQRSFTEILDIGMKLQLPNRENMKKVITRANTILTKVHDHQLLSNRGRKTIGAASVYVAIRENNLAITMDDIFKVASCSRSAMRKAVSRIYHILGVGNTSLVPSIQTAEFIDWYCTNKGFHECIRKRAQEIAEHTIEMESDTGQLPVVVAISAIKWAKGIPDSINEYCTKWNLCECTRENAHEMVKNLSKSGLIENREPKAVAAAVIFAVCPETDRRPFNEMAQFVGVPVATMEEVYIEVVSTMP